MKIIQGLIKSNIIFSSLSIKIVAFGLFIGFLQFHIPLLGSILLILFLFFLRERRILLLTIFLISYGYLQFIQQVKLQEVSSNLPGDLTGIIIKIDSKNERENNLTIDLDEFYLDASVAVSKFENVSVGNRINIDSPKGLNDISSYNFYAKNIGISSGGSESEIFQQNSFLELLYFLKSKVKENILRNVSYPHGEVLYGMVFGSSVDTPEDIEESFKNAGVSHLLSASGANIILISSIFFIPLELLPRKIKFVLKLIVLLLVTLLIGWFNIPTFRAFVQLLYSESGKFLGKEISFTNQICFCFSVIFIINPFSLLQIGTQLSFGAVIGINFANKILEKN